jgi:hypothetical protein
MGECLVEWVLIVWVFTGENIGIKTTDFTTEQRCEAAALWLNKASEGKWRESYTPKARCFKI